MLINFNQTTKKKEFGIYMTLGMSKQQISKILLGETILYWSYFSYYWIIVNYFIAGNVNYRR